MSLYRYPVPTFFGVFLVIVLLSFFLYPGSGLNASLPNLDSFKALTAGESKQQEDLIPVRKIPLVCDPHELPGSVYLPKNYNSIDGALDTHWEPMSESADLFKCPSKSYVKQMSQALRAYRDHGSKTKLQDLPWAFRNRTILLFGDSIDRGQVEYTCRMLGGDRDIIQPDTDLWPQADITLKPNTKGWKPNSYSARSFPTYCHVRELDLMLVNVFHFGLDDEEYFAWKDQYGPPYTVEARFDAIVLPLVEKLGRKIDILSFGSGLWDLARFGRIDDGQLTRNDETTPRYLTPERLSWFSRRYSAILSKIANSDAFHSHQPEHAPIQLFSRILHISGEDGNEEFQKWWQVGGGGKDGNKHTFYFPSWRVNELNNAIRNSMLHTNHMLFEKKVQNDAEWKIDTWGEKLFGLAIYDPGNVHPHYCATTIWLEQMLFRLINGA